MPTLHHPLFITAGLDAGLKVADGTTLSLTAVGRTSEGRVQYRWMIEDPAGVLVATGDDLHSGVGAEVDYSDTFVTLLAFLGSDAESFMDHEPDDEPLLFGEVVAEWAHQNSDELSMLANELEYPQQEDQ